MATTKRSARAARSPTRVLLWALQQALEGALGARARAALTAFDPGRSRPRPRRRPRPFAVKSVAAFAAANVEGLARLTQHAEDAVRHAATFALGHSGDARAVAPLMALLCQQQDFYDHDFLYRALADLGAVAVPPLARFALEGSEDEAYQAVQALGQSRADVLPVLRRVRAARRPLPRRFFLAYQNRCDPRGLPDLLAALSDSEHRGDALSAAETLLRYARPRPRPGPRQLRRWARALLPLCRHPDINVHANAIACLGRLGLGEAAPLLFELATAPEQVVKESAYYQRWLAHAALDALALLDTAQARGFLARLTRLPPGPTAVRAALRLLEGARSRSDPALRQQVVRGLASGELGMFDGASAARRDLRLKRALLRAAAEARGDERTRLLGTLVRTLPLGAEGWRARRARERLLASCPAPVNRWLARAIEAELRRRRES